MKFHPAISIILGIVTILMWFILAGILGLDFSKSISNTSGGATLIILILGGFVATYFTEDKKIRYSIYEGLIFTAFVGLSKNLKLIFAAFIAYVLFIGIGGFIGKMTDNKERQNFKNHFEKGFNPIITIVMGFIVANFFYYLLLGITNIYTSYNIKTAALTIAVISNVIGGFTATFFAKEKKIQYGIYTGLIILISSLAMKLIHGTLHVNYSSISIVEYLLFAGIGGFIGKITDNTGRQSLKKRFNNGYNPIITIVMGYFIATFFNNSILLITCTYNSNPFGVTQFIVAAISFVIGGFTATFFAKEKKIQYGLYTGMIILIVNLVLQLIYGPTIHEPYYIKIGKIAGYLIASGIGGYLGKTIYARKQKEAE